MECGYIHSLERKAGGLKKNSVAIQPQTQANTKWTNCTRNCILACAATQKSETSHCSDSSIKLLILLLSFTMSGGSLYLQVDLASNLQRRRSPGRLKKEEIQTRRLNILLLWILLPS